MTIDHFPNAPGTYVLVLEAEHPTTITVGRLGTMLVTPGWYLYTGSALGGGGLAGRLRHHLRPVARPHWHIDYLRLTAIVRAVWYVADATRWEHHWAELLSRMAAPVALTGFGASDCSCTTHAFRRPDEPSFAEFAGVAQTAHIRLPPLHCANIPLTQRSDRVNPTGSSAR